MQVLNIGINKYPAGNALSKCVQDARDLNAYFEAGKSALLLDRAATRDKIIERVGNTITATKRGEWCVVTYSGHGTQVDDLDGDEPDRIDEAMVSVELETILDDEVYELSKLLVVGARGLLIADSCFSGTMQRAVPTFDRRHLDALRRASARYVPPSEVTVPKRKVVNVGKQPVAPQWIVISGCADFEVSYEGKHNGVLTGALLESAPTHPRDRDTIAQVFGGARVIVAADNWPQHPQLVASTANKRREWPRP